MMRRIARRAIVVVATGLQAFTALADQIEQYRFVPPVLTSVETARINFDLVLNDTCPRSYFGRQSVDSPTGRVFLDLIVWYSALSCFQLINYKNLDVNFGAVPAGRYEAHIRLIFRRVVPTITESIHDEEIQDLLVRPGQADLHFLSEVSPFSATEIPLPEITGMASAGTKIAVAEKSRHAVLALDPLSSGFAEMTTQLGDYVPDGIASFQSVLARHLTLDGQYLLTLDSTGAVTQALRLSPPAGGPLEGYARSSGSTIRLFTSRADPPELLERDQPIATGTPLTSLDFDGAQLLGADPAGARVLMINSELATQLLPPGAIRVPIPLPVLGALVDRRSFPREHTPSGAALASIPDGILMTGLDSSLLTFRPLRIALNEREEIAPQWPPFLQAVDLLVGKMEDLTLTDDGVLLGGATCVADDLLNGTSIPLAAQALEPGGVLYVIARPSIPGGDYGPAWQGMRRLAPIDSDCLPTL